MQTFLAQLGLSTKVLRRTAAGHPKNIKTKKVHRAGGVRPQQFQ
jgi:hypothetical protein